MDADRWTLLSTLVADALDLPPGERAAFLAEAADDDGLRAEAADLLAAHIEAEALDALTSLYGEGGPLPGPVGPWRLVGRLGAGGMGVVYDAERDDTTFRQRAALKLIRPGFGADFRARFVHERAVLAGLDHPGVARLLDGGLTADGLPYLAMEFVEGAPITEYAEREGLDVRARLGLFIQACEAVAHTHRHLVVHRDLKPAHILVTEGEVPGEGRRSTPRVKLLDFGVAKLLSDEGGEALTKTGLGPLTPQYAAPEQLRGEPVTTATDVYALGVVLFELLTGRRPYDLCGLEPSGVYRVVTETPPPRPSAAEGGSAHTRRLRGDLDTIVLKALAKEPSRRYPGAAALADDIQRHLAGLPIEARPASAAYRARLFVRRHTLAVAAAAAVVLALAVGLGATLWQAHEARTARFRAEARFEIAREAARAMIYDVHDAVAGLPGSTPAREVIVERALTYLARLAEAADDDPDLRVDLAGAYLRIGNVQGNPTDNNLGRTADALTSYRLGLGLLDGLPGGLPDSLAAAAAEAEGRLWEKLGVVVAHVVAPDSALALFDRALEAHRRALRLQPDSAARLVFLATSHINRADYVGHPSFPNTGRPDAALAEYARARALLQRVPETERSQFGLRMEGITYEREGTLLRHRGDLDGAVGPARRALALREQIAARPDATTDAVRDVGVSRETLGLLAIERGRWAEARDELEAAHATYQRIADADPESRNARQTLAIGHLHLARLYGDPDGPDLGRPAEARRHATEALRLFRALADGDPGNARLQALVGEARTLHDRIG